MRVVQCWDDGDVEDIRLTGILRRYGAKASFNLNIGKHRAKRHVAWVLEGREIWKLALPELCSVYNGFLVANHSLHHPWLTKIPKDDMRREIREGRDRLEQHFGYSVTGFAYPFGGYDVAVEAAVLEAGHVYGRTIENVDTVFPPASPAAFHPSRHHGAPDFWEVFERTKAQGKDAVFYFWGHSYEFAAEDDWRAIEDKIARITADPDTEWTDLPKLFEPA
jgi:peptidoglycan-N-acetylglucosamine deacetylase